MQTFLNFKSAQALTRLKAATKSVYNLAIKLKIATFKVLVKLFVGRSSCKSDQQIVFRLRK